MPAADPREQRDALSTYIGSLDDVILGYLFGSHARGQVWAHSDVDVALLLAGEPDAARCLERRLAAIGGIADVLSTDDVDVVILNQAPPALAYAVLRDGILLFCRDEPARIAFQVRAVNEYLDFKPVLERHERALLQRAERGELLDGYNPHRGALERYQVVRERLERTPPSDV